MRWQDVAVVDDEGGQVDRARGRCRKWLFAGSPVDCAAISRCNEGCDVTIRVHRYGMW